jgi:hypothetical protein
MNKLSYSKLFLFLLLPLILGCHDTKNEKFQNCGLPFDMQENNIAALFTMTNESGRIENLKMMESIFEDESLGFKVESHHNKPSKYIYDKLNELSKQVGEYGTLLIYLNSHGGGSGSRFGMTSSDGSFKFSKALNSIAQANKVKRLIVLIDTCHASGGIQEGFQGKEKKIENLKTRLPELPDYYPAEEQDYLSSFFTTKKIRDDYFFVDYGSKSGAYSESLIIASSSAEDLSMRGAFASRLKKAFEKIKNNKEISISNFLKEFANLHGNTNQKPHYKVIPFESMLEEPLFKNPLLRDIPIIDRQHPDSKIPKGFIPSPEED